MVSTLARPYNTFYSSSRSSPSSSELDDSSSSAKAFFYYFLNSLLIIRIPFYSLCHSLSPVIPMILFYAFLAKKGLLIVPSIIRTSLRTVRNIGKSSSLIKFIEWGFLICSCSSSSSSQSISKSASSSSFNSMRSSSGFFFSCLFFIYVLICSCNFT